MKWLDKLKDAVNTVKSRNSPKKGMDLRDALSLLTNRERDVFNALLKVRKVKDAAEELGIKYPTLHTHCKSIYKKLGVNSRAELIMRYGAKIKNY